MEGKKGVGARNEEGDVPETTFIIPYSIQTHYCMPAMPHILEVVKQ
jgi:hypothetical protein